MFRKTKLYSFDKCLAQRVLPHNKSTYEKTYVTNLVSSFESPYLASPFCDFFLSFYFIHDRIVLLLLWEHIYSYYSVAIKIFLFCFFFCYQ